MVWIHGGAWQFGSAEMQNGAALAKCGDVIVVALSYRLGVFGFLFGNWGLWDQIEGLKWVQVRESLRQESRDHHLLGFRSRRTWTTYLLRIVCL